MKGQRRSWKTLEIYSIGTPKSVICWMKTRVILNSGKCSRKYASWIIWNQKRSFNMKHSSRIVSEKLKRLSVSISCCFMKPLEISWNRALRKHEREDKKLVSFSHWSNRWRSKKRKTINSSMIQVCNLIIIRSIHLSERWSSSFNTKISFCKLIRLDQKTEEVFKKFAECLEVSLNRISSLIVCSIKLLGKSTMALTKIIIKTMMVITLNNWLLMKRKMKMTILLLIVISNWILNTLKRALKERNLKINHLKSEN